MKAGIIQFTFTAYKGDLVGSVLTDTFICGILLTGLGIWVTPYMLEFMSTPEDVLPSASVYLEIYFSGVFGLLVYNMGSAILRAVGDTKRPLYILLGAGILNVLLNLFFVEVLHMTVNGVAARNGGDLSQVLHTVFFSPEDLFLIREGAAARRRFMDQSLCQLRPRYAEALTEYGRLYDHKTRILRDSDEYPQLLDTLPDFNHRLCQVGAVLISYRARYVQVLAVHARRAHWECSGEREELALSYQTVKTVEDPLGPVQDIAGALEEHQARHYQAELASRLWLSGPHKDDIAVTVNGLEARHFCSQGQVRTAALSLKLADREIHKTAIGEYPVMLLDDVLSELDPRRQEYVLNRIAGGQVFITCCENDRLDALLSGRVYHIREGRVL